MGAIRLLCALKKQGVDAKKVTDKGLMFIDASLNGKATKSVMVDTGATYNFISEAEAKRLGLKLQKDAGRMKAVNSKALPTAGLAKQVCVRMGTWEGLIDLIVVKLDDFDVILGMDFLVDKGGIPIPGAHSLLLMGDRLAVIGATMRPNSDVKLLFALQFKKGVRR